MTILLGIGCFIAGLLVMRIYMFIRGYNKCDECGLNISHGGFH